ncbi:hypothetical protein JCM3774_000617 [Rhodotorula dairenensis]
MPAKRRAVTYEPDPDYPEPSTSAAPVAPPPRRACTVDGDRVWPQAGPTPKKQKKNKSNEAEPEPEKRLKLFKKACPKATQERADRVRSQRFFCVDRRRTSPTSEQFSVLGSTGNLYTVKVNHLPSCDCPDGAKGNHCKHLASCRFLLGVPSTSNLWYQSALLTGELQSIFSCARPAPRTLLEARVQSAFEIASGKKKLEPGPDGQLPAADGPVQKRIPQEGDSCPICYEDFEPGSQAGLVFCLTISGCGNALHSECFSNWAKTSSPTTCPLCREKWSTASASGLNAAAALAAGPSFSADGYQNFAAQAGISTERDTSTYYHGPRRRERYYGGSWNRYGKS